jgi:hypothetical protein
MPRNVCIGANATERPPRLCEHCGLLMKYVGKLSRSGGRPQIKVYRCDNCSRIESDETSITQLSTYYPIG